MLQDLDNLAARIGHMAQLMHELQAERADLRARLKQLEQDRNALREELERREAENASLQREAEAEKQSLHQQLVEQKSRLQAIQAHNIRLGQVAGEARNQVDSILMRLPGASGE